MHVPKTVAELLETLESLDGMSMQAPTGEWFPVGIWAMQASNIIRSQQLYIAKCCRPVIIGAQRNEG